MFSFVPASTRAALARLLGRDRLGSKFICDLPPNEVHGEIEWHADLLRYHAGEIAGRAYLVPEHQRQLFYEEEGAAMRSSGHRTTAETAAVIALARHAVSSLSKDPVSREDWSKHLEWIARQKEELAHRLSRMQASCNGGELRG